MLFERKNSEKKDENLIIAVDTYPGVNDEEVLSGLKSLDYDRLFLMKDVCGLDKNAKNYAWSFDGVPEENSILLDYGNAVVELPAMDLVLYKPIELLGPKVYSRFGAEFPIRFDFLDTIGGQNLSLQVHPVTEYIHR